MRVHGGKGAEASSHVSVTGASQHPRQFRQNGSLSSRWGKAAHPFRRPGERDLIDPLSSVARGATQGRVGGSRHPTPIFLSSPLSSVLILETLADPQTHPPPRLPGQSFQPREWLSGGPAIAEGCMHPGSCVGILGGRRGHHWEETRPTQGWRVGENAKPSPQYLPAPGHRVCAGSWLQTRHTHSPAPSPAWPWSCLHRLARPCALGDLPRHSIESVLLAVCCFSSLLMSQGSSGFVSLSFPNRLFVSLLPP